MASLHDDVSAILTIRPAPGHPFASLSVCDQERAGQPEPLMEEAATWANLHDLAHEWGSFACALASLTSPASARVFQAIGMAFLALSHEESAYAHYFLLGNRLRYPPSTFTVGQYLCTTCGATYYCPGCTLSIPRNARARFCPEHHAEQEARDHAARKQHVIQKKKGVPS